jgi:hypothetical protein
MDQKRFYLTMVILFCFLIILFKQLIHYQPYFRYIFILLFMICLIALYYESNENGCSIYDCSDNTVSKSITTQNLACKENDRVSWRRANILSFIVLIALNSVHSNYNANLIIFFITWFLLYFYLNFDQYHRFRILCNESTK